MTILCNHEPLNHYFMLIILNNPNSQQPTEENKNFLDDEEEHDFMENDENDEFDKPEGNIQISRAITKDAASKRQERVNVQAKMKQPIVKKKMAAMKESEMEQQKLTFLKSVKKEWNRGIRERKLMMLKIDLWLP